MSGIKVLLADDHVIVAEGLKSLLQSEFDLVGTVADGRALLEAAKRLKPNVIVADISMPLLNGIDALRLMKKDGQPAKVVFLTMHGEAQLAAEAFRAGASGYLLKNTGLVNIIEALKELYEGGSPMSSNIARKLVRNFQQMPSANSPTIAESLSSRENEILQLLARGQKVDRGVGGEDPRRLAHQPASAHSGAAHELSHRSG